MKHNSDFAKFMQLQDFIEQILLNESTQKKNDSNGISILLFADMKRLHLMSTDWSSHITIILSFYVCLNSITIYFS